MVSLSIEPCLGLKEMHFNTKKEHKDRNFFIPERDGIRTGGVGKILPCLFCFLHLFSVQISFLCSFACMGKVALIGDVSP